MKICSIIKVYELDRWVKEKHKEMKWKTRCSSRLMFGVLDKLFFSMERKKKNKLIKNEKAIIKYDPVAYCCFVSWYNAQRCVPPWVPLLQLGAVLLKKSQFLLVDVILYKEMSQSHLNFLQIYYCICLFDRCTISNRLFGWVIYHYNAKYTSRTHRYVPTRLLSCKICQHLSPDASRTRGCA